MRNVELEITELLLSEGLPAYSPSLTSGTMILDIWSGFCMRWSGMAGRGMFYHDVFMKCVKLTSIALEYGARIDESIDEEGQNILHCLGLAHELLQGQLLELVWYFLGLDIDIEHRNNRGQTPLIAAIAAPCPSLSLVRTYLDANANLGAVDNIGRGYLRIALERDGFLFGDSSYFFVFHRQYRLLVLLLSADRRFKMRAIKPNETPRLIELAFSAVAWDVWTSVFQELDWDMTEMNKYRYRVLDEPLPSYLEHYEEARLQMLRQTEFRLDLSRGEKAGEL